MKEFGTSTTSSARTNLQRQPAERPVLQDRDERLRQAYLEVATRVLGAQDESRRG